MKVRSCIALLVLAFVAHAQQTNEVHFSGIAINTTKTDNPLAAPIELSVGNSQCRLTVSLPLVGSGSCRVAAYDRQSGKIVIISDGPPSITWNGTVKGNLASGTYSILSGHQSGSFYLAITEQSTAAPAPTPGYAYIPPATRSGCSPAIESSISGEFHGWDGETVFKLDNDQIWQQAEYDYEYEYEYHPDVTIYETSGGCKMKVEDMEETIFVKRIK